MRSADSQMPLPFKHGLGDKARTKRRRVQRWPLAGGQVARTCPRCGCDREHPCKIVLAAGKGSGVCCPAGAFGLRVCSACQSNGDP